MSEEEPEDDKVTVLFPDGDDEEPSDGAESEESEADEETEAVDDAGGDEEETEAGDGESGDDNVVRLDFQNKSEVGKPPEPVDQESGDEQRADDVEAALEGPNPKYEVFERMIGEGMVMVTLDTRVDGVEVPPKYEGLPELRLNFSHMFHIDDFDYDPSGVRASLSFDGTRYFCDVPWEAVFMLYGHESGDVLVFEPPESE